MLNDFRVQTIVWDKAIDRIYETVRASEGDSNGRKLRVQILDRGKYVDLGGTSLSLAWKTPKEDAKGLDAFELVDSETGTFEIYYTTEMLGNVGRLSATLVLVDSVGRIESSPFAISVIESNVDDDSVQSENSFTALTQALITVSQYDSRISNLQTTKADRSYVDSENRKVIRKVDDEVEKLDEIDREITAQLAQTVNKNEVGGLQPSPLRNVKIEENNSDPIILDIFDGYVWGRVGTTIYRRKENKASAWDLYTENGLGFMRLLPTDDGEVIGITTGYIYKSKNFLDPQNLTWVQKYATNDTAYHMRWGLDGDGTKFIATTYAAMPNWSHSRYAVISLDAGETFQIAYDTEAIHGSDVNANSHIHAVAYDHYADRFYLSEGHSGDGAGVGGLYVSTDDGQTWNRADGMKQIPAPTTITVTPTGLVCGSDNAVNGLYGVVRMDDPMDEELVLLYEWKTHRDGLVGFAERGFYHEKTGITYVVFKTNFTDVNPIIVGGTPTSGDIVYEWESGGSTNDNRLQNVVVTSDNELLAYGTTAGTGHNISAIITSPGAKTFKDDGNILGGKSSRATSLSVGRNSKVEGQQSMAIGLDSKVLGGATQFGLSIGNNSESASHSVIIGHQATGRGQTVVIGDGAKGEGTSVIIGYNATSSTAGAIAIGRNSIGSDSGVTIGSNTITGSHGVSIGEGAKAGFRSVSIGSGSSAENDNSVAIGRNVTTTLSDQFNVGRKHFVIEQFVSSNISGALPDKSGAIFTRELSGKMQLCVKLSDSTHVHVLAETE